MSSTDSESQQSEPAAAEAPVEVLSYARSQRPWRAVLLGLVAALLVTAIVFFFAIRSNTPRLTRAEYDAAVERWEKNGPADYDLDLELTGNRPSTIHVEVRQGEVVHMLRDGVEPRQKRTWDYWSVAGQLETIGEELEMAKDPATSFNVPAGSQVVMWAQFDPQWGYPREFHRVVLGASFEVHWTITRFQVGEKK
jgi:hypothetical protein